MKETKSNINYEHGVAPFAGCFAGKLNASIGITFRPSFDDTTLFHKTGLTRC